MEMDLSPGADRFDGFLFDWKLDVERLEREARTAVQANQPNDWALVEAECSQDLISAELKAVVARKERSMATIQTIGHLKAWAMRIDRVVRHLRAINAAGTRP